MALSDFLDNFINRNQAACQVDSLNFFTVKFELTPTDSGIGYLYKELINPSSTKKMYDLTMFVQNIELPSLNVVNDTPAETMVGSIQTHKMFTTPSDQTFRMSIINTKHPIIENMIYPWLREVTTPAWQYAQYPYTTAKFIIDFSGKDNDYHSNVQYVINGARPTSITPIRPTQEVNTKLDREVTFTFDYMYVQEGTSTNKFGSLFFINPIKM